MPLLEITPKPIGNPGGTPQTLIRDPKLRLQIHAQKQSRILQWLKTETYSSPDVLALVLGLARQSLHKTLTAMRDQNLIRHAKVPVVGGHQSLWGITEHGLALAWDLSGNQTPAGKVFEPGRISALRLKHILELQKMKWQALQAGWSGWKNCDRGVKPQPTSGKFKHRPDALAIDPAGLVIAVELELTFKTVQRYAQEVLPSHIRQMYVERTYQQVLWVCPTAEVGQRMRNLLGQALEWLRAKKHSAAEQLSAYQQQCGDAKIFRMGSFEDWTRQWQGSQEERAGNLRSFLWSHFQEAIKSGKSLDRQVQEEQAWMPASDHPLIRTVRDEFEHALMKLRQQEQARQQREQEERQRKQREEERRYAQELAAQEEAQRRANSLAGKVGKLFGK